MLIYTPTFEENIILRSHVSLAQNSGSKNVGLQQSPKQIHVGLNHLYFCYTLMNSRWDTTYRLVKGNSNAVHPCPPCAHIRHSSSGSVRCHREIITFHRELRDQTVCRYKILLVIPKTRSNPYVPLCFAMTTRLRWDTIENHFVLPKSLAILGCRRDQRKLLPKKNLQTHVSHHNKP